MITRVRLAGLAAAVAVLAACSPADAPASPSASPAATASTATPASATPLASPTPTPTPMPSAAAAAAADCSLDGIVPGRLGCLDANLPIAGNPGESSLTWEPDYCSPGEGRFTYAAAPTLVSLWGHTGEAIGRIDVYDPTITTAAGVHVGSTDAEVAAAYPDNPAELADPGTQLVVLGGADGFVTIEIANGWGADPWTVANIRIYAADQDPNVRVYGTEDFAGACPFDF